MEYREFTVFVEGPDDRRFVEEVIRPEFEKLFGEEGGIFEIVEYPHKRKGFIEGLITKITETENAGYLLLADIDSAACVTAKKEALQERYPFLSFDRIVIVVKEIEGWYFAGLDNASCRRFKVPAFDKTDTLTKERFNAAIPKKAKSRTDFMLEILKYFDLEVAKQKNKSFRYFLEKHLSDL